MPPKKDSNSNGFWSILFFILLLFFVFVWLYTNIYNLWSKKPEERQKAKKNLIVATVVFIVVLISEYYNI